MRTTIPLLVLLLTAACSSDPTPTSIAAAPTFPSVVVDAWLDALNTGDYDAAARYVEPIGASFVLAVENALADEPLAELLESGWNAELIESFWSSFTSEFPLFAGVGLSGLVVGRHRDLDTTAGSFAVVEIEIGETDGWIITRATDAGTWQVDLLATLGGAFVPLVFDRVVGLSGGAAGELIGDTIRSTVLVSLDAAAVAYPDDIRLETEIARIRQVLGVR